MEFPTISYKQPPETVEVEKPFTKPGECLDEVTFKFDDGNKLFVSENFLRYVSPVFKTMFEHNWKEKTTRTVELTGKVYDEFLDFLLCLHPCVQKPVNDKNVLQLVVIADEYQTTHIVKKCKKAMEDMLQSNLKPSEPGPVNKLRRARTCLQILTTAKRLDYKEIIEKACTTIGQFEHALFTGTVPEDQFDEKLRLNYMFHFGNVKPENEDPIKDCRKLFDELPDTLKIKLLLARLRFCDNL